MVTFRAWRDLFWLQTALGGFGLGLIFMLLPETTHRKLSDELEGLNAMEKAATLWQWTNPFRVIGLYRYPNLIAVQYTKSIGVCLIVASLEHGLAPDTDQIRAQPALWIDIADPVRALLHRTRVRVPIWHILRQYVDKRSGERVPEDRLNSCLPFLGGGVPACVLVYGWSIERERGGVSLPVVVLFLQGVCQLFCFPSLNTYCLDVMQTQSVEVVAGNYAIRYLFAALSSALCLPAIEAIEVGWFSNISAVFLVMTAALTWLTAVFGKQWRDAVDTRKRTGQRHSDATA